MRTLIEIIEDVKDGKKPEYEELRYALVVMDFLSIGIDTFLLMDLYGKGKLQDWDKKKFELKWEIKQKALKSDPKVYAGSLDPDLPERQKERALFKKIGDKCIKKSQEV